MPTSGADFQTRYAETQTILSNLTNTKQSTPGTFQAARAGINPTKDRRVDLGVDSEVQSTHLQSEVTDSSQFRPATQPMAPHRTTAKGLQTLLTATAEVVASSSPTPSQRWTFSVRPPQVHRDLPLRTAFSATPFLKGRKANGDTKRLSMTTTTTGGNVVSQECELVSNAQRLVRRNTSRPLCLVQTVKWRT